MLLIDVDELKSRAKDVILQNGAKHRCIDATIISELPKTELVRCKDCCNYDNGKCYNKIEHPTKDISYVDPDWFCADGKRKD